MKISIIIPTMNHLEDCLRPCCESIIQATNFDGKKEIIVVGNGCTDETRQYIEYLGEPFKFLDFSEPLGFSKANNEGLKIAKGEYLLLLNNDTIIFNWGKDVWLNLLLNTFENYPNCGIAGPSMSYNKFAKSEFLIFFCVMISRKCFEQVGFLDEIFKEGSGEDIAYCIEAKKKGFELHQVPPDPLTTQSNYMIGKYPIYHKAEQTVHTLKNWNEIYFRNNEILARRYGNV